MSAWRFHGYSGCAFYLLDAESEERQHQVEERREYRRVGARACIVVIGPGTTGSASGRLTFAPSTTTSSARSYGQRLEVGEEVARGASQCAVFREGAEGRVLSSKDAVHEQPPGNEEQQRHDGAADVVVEDRDLFHPHPLARALRRQPTTTQHPRQILPHLRHHCIDFIIFLLTTLSVSSTKEQVAHTRLVSSMPLYYHVTVGTSVIFADHLPEHGQLRSIVAVHEAFHIRRRHHHAQVASHVLCAVLHLNLDRALDVKDAFL